MAEKKKGIKKNVQNGKGKWLVIRNNQTRAKGNLKRVLKSSGLNAAKKYAEDKNLMYTYQRLATTLSKRHQESKNPKHARRSPAQIIASLAP